jgi:hypothetical protein
MMGLRLSTTIVWHSKLVLLAEGYHMVLGDKLTKAFFTANRK